MPYTCGMADETVHFLQHAALQRLLTVLSNRGYRVTGPREKEGVIVYGPLSSQEDLPLGLEDEQAPGRYRLHENGAKRHFSWANGPQALKPYLFVPEEPLWRSEIKQDGSLAFSPCVPDVPPLAVVGVRACDLAALEIHDRHFSSDPHYQARRDRLFLVAVNCTHPAATCFCHSTGDGPVVRQGHDLLLDELDQGFVLRAGSRAGRSVLQELGLRPATEEEQHLVRRQTGSARRAMERRLLPDGLAEALVGNEQHPHWQAVAERCLSCGNCTSVCPTCFCYRERDEASLDGRDSLRSRCWDSCFSPEHSYIHGRVLRQEPRHRYRQWVMHKLSYWHEQFGRSGCVGCGRCIAWCPAGIDLTREVAILCGEGEA